MKQEQEISTAFANLAHNLARAVADFKMPGPFRAEPCGCKSPNCRDWHVHPLAAVQSVGFTERQARAVAAFLNAWSWETR